MLEADQRLETDRTSEADSGLSGSGKTTVAQQLDRRLHRAGKCSFLLDGDVMRDGITKGLGSHRARVRDRAVRGSPRARAAAGCPEFRALARRSMLDNVTYRLLARVFCDTVLDVVDHCRAFGVIERGDGGKASR